MVAFSWVALTRAGEKIAAVGQIPNKAELERDPLVRVFEGRGRTLMSGLGDGHTHFTWNGGDLNRLGELDVEEHVLLTIKSAQCFLDSGYTMYVLYYFFCSLLIMQVLRSGCSQGPT